MSVRRLLVFATLSLVAACSSLEEDELVADDAALTEDGELEGPLVAGARLVTTANVNFRTAPVIAPGNIKRVLPKGAAVVAVGGEAVGGFFAVTHAGVRGFVSARYLGVAAADAGAPGDGAASSSAVTVIGDSHSDFEGSGGGAGVFGFRLSRILADHGTSIALYAASSSAPNWWLDGTAVQAATWGYTQTVDSPARRTCSRGNRTGTCVPKVSAILQIRPNVFVIEQGSNLFGRTDADVTNQVRSMLRQIEGKTDACLWVGAPRARTSEQSEQAQEDLWQLISQNAAPTCFVYDSRFVPRTDDTGKPVTDAQGNLIVDVPLPYAGSDGIHLASATATRWADGVGHMIEWVRGRSR